MLPHPLALPPLLTTTRLSGGKKLSIIWQIQSIKTINLILCPSKAVVSCIGQFADQQGKYKHSFNQLRKTKSTGQFGATGYPYHTSQASLTYPCSTQGSLTYPYTPGQLDLSLLYPGQLDLSLLYPGQLEMSIWWPSFMSLQSTHYTVFWGLGPASWWLA